MGESLRVEPRVAQKKKKVNTGNEGDKAWLWKLQTVDVVERLRGLYWEGCSWELLGKGDVIRFGIREQSRWASRKPELA